MGLKRILVFGTGVFYKKRRDTLFKLLRGDMVIGFLDNRADKIRECDNLPVFLPSQIKQISYDLIVIMSIYYDEMKTQLLDLGVSERKIWNWEMYSEKKKLNFIKIYSGADICLTGKRVLIISDDMNYNGGCLAGIYAAIALKERGYQAYMCARCIDEKLISEVVETGVVLLEMPLLPYVEDEKLIMMLFDFVIVNTFCMTPMAFSMITSKPVLWWIHEPEMFYYPPLNVFSQYSNNNDIDRINILAVSSVAKKNFNKNFNCKISRLMPYGIPEMLSKKSACETNKKNAKLVFAVIGTVDERKAQDLFLEAILKIPESERRKCCFWIIGQIQNNEYGKAIRDYADGIVNVRITGKLTRKEMMGAYNSIDVVVCCSREDPLPIVVTEGLMYEKTCIISDMIGSTSYLSNGKDSIWFRNNDASDLSKKIQWVIDNRQEAEEIGKRGRAVYEDVFTLSAFGERLENELYAAKEKWEKNA